MQYQVLYSKIAMNIDTLNFTYLYQMKDYKQKWYFIEEPISSVMVIPSCEKYVGIWELMISRTVDFVVPIDLHIPLI